jgi:hypothetical protein
MLMMRTVVAMHVGLDRRTENGKRRGYYPLLHYYSSDPLFELVLGCCHSLAMYRRPGALACGKLPHPRWR